MAKAKDLALDNPGLAMLEADCVIKPIEDINSKIYKLNMDKNHPDLGYILTTTFWGQWQTHAQGIDARPSLKTFCEISGFPPEFGKLPEPRLPGTAPNSFPCKKAAEKYATYLAQQNPPNTVGSTAGAQNTSIFG